ncbi:hypothetical protein Tco_0410567 [Tanacetum coccineum]
MVLLNPSTSPPPRVSPPPPTQDNASMDITLTLSPNTPLDVQFDTPSPSPPIIAHPIPWNFLEAHATLCTVFSAIREFVDISEENSRVLVLEEWIGRREIYMSIVQTLNSAKGRI